LPHSRLQRVDFIAIGGRTVGVDLPEGAEIAVKRSLLDQLLMNRAAEAGVEVRQPTTVRQLLFERDAWQIIANEEALHARVVIAADGRNSTVARLLGALPPATRERVGLQTHIPMPLGFGERVVLQFLPEGYSGQAPVGDAQLNVCLVATPPKLDALKSWAAERFGIPVDHAWRTITPLRRAAVNPGYPRLFLAGDAARVVEPFTGEGIYYALRSGELAAEAAISLIRTGDEARARHAYAAAHEQLYRGRLWLNRIARAAVLSPRATSLLLRAAVIHPALLRSLTAKIVR
ncbi:MAG TPA: NAD(P)/FAD-dependent oxidoreductase, partial [Chthoniobacterales bacterium]|nr:NAD(P)/FAD-dependent oxidoreductase [Chthoniobacterales bacterium]